MNSDTFLPPLPYGEERSVVIGRSRGFHLKPPPAPAALRDFITSDAQLFETIHMGSVEVDAKRWRLQVDGLVHNPFSIDLDALKRLPSVSITAFHECFGSPLVPTSANLWRVGNVRWTGVPLAVLLEHAQLEAGATHVWSDGLDSGEFGGRSMNRYRKDLPLSKALSYEVLVAYEMNGKPLTRERGGPVRLVVPGWFGTNMTKWLCRLSVRGGRANSPFTTLWYNRDSEREGEVLREPVWSVEPNSLITHPAQGDTISADEVAVKGWAWSGNGIDGVALSTDGAATWLEAEVLPRREFEWQQFAATLPLPQTPGLVSIIARARDADGSIQPLSGTRNAAHSTQISWFLP
ncbi:molybdopterin-dependent oxidoreductase [Variovorax sp. EBFNA2]|uniref:molybdopterin-dependent oxidoreductase n=1 Tax=Variovorax sp. EBFNA2 TaxID=3342097 RepID=UPI0029BFB9B4|nr:molybdopterin-dependent oxidoreductase [Variovorax boronicumulans]WPG41597.1 molybdopterin-dependent oxidoreductase [Variovorax boronicumulans]